MCMMVSWHVPVFLGRGSWFKAILEKAVILKLLYNYIFEYKALSMHKFATCKIHTEEPLFITYLNKNIEKLFNDFYEDF